VRRLATALALSAVLAVAATAAADDEAPLSLEQAMATARANSRGVAAAEAQLEASRQRLRQARAHRLPSVRLEETWLSTDSPAEAFALTLNQERFSFADFVAGDPNRPEAVESATTRLAVELPLYTGGELTGRIRQAELASDAAGAEARGSADAAALAAAEAWLDLAGAGERVALLERSLATVERHVELAAAYVDQGMRVRSELLRAEVERSRIEDLLAEARGQAGVAAAALAFRLGADDGAVPAAAPLSPPAALDRDLEAWLAAADARPDLEAARRRVAAAALEGKLARAALLPRVGLMLRGDLVDDSPFGDHGDSTAVVVHASLDLFAGGRHRAAAAAADAEADAARLRVADFAAAVRLEVRAAWVAADAARRRQATAGAALEAAREAERITSERFASGVVKTLDLLDAVTARRETEARELAARIDAHRSALRLAAAAGRPPEEALAEREPNRNDLPETPGSPTP